MGLLIALGLAAAAVFLAEQLDTSLHSVEDLRAMANAPVLVTIPEIVTSGDQRRSALRFVLGAASTVVALAAIVGLSYFLATENSQLTQMLLR